MHARCFVRSLACVKDCGQVRSSGDADTVGVVVILFPLLHAAVLEAPFPDLILGSSTFASDHFLPMSDIDPVPHEVEIKVSSPDRPTGQDQDPRSLAVPPGNRLLAEDMATGARSREEREVVYRGTIEFTTAYVHAVLVGGVELPGTEYFELPSFVTLMDGVDAIRRGIKPYKLKGFHSYLRVLLGVDEFLSLEQQLTLRVAERLQNLRFRTESLARLQMDQGAGR